MVKPKSLPPPSKAMRERRGLPDLPHPIPQPLKYGPKDWQDGRMPEFLFDKTDEGGLLVIADLSKAPAAT